MKNPAQGMGNGKWGRACRSSTGPISLFPIPGSPFPAINVGEQLGRIRVRRLIRELERVFDFGDYFGREGLELRVVEVSGGTHDVRENLDWVSAAILLDFVLASISAVCRVR